MNTLKQVVSKLDWTDVVELLIAASLVIEWPIAFFSMNAFTGTQIFTQILRLALIPVINTWDKDKSVWEDRIYACGVVVVLFEILFTTIVDAVNDQGLILFTIARYQGIVPFVFGLGIIVYHLVYLPMTRDHAFSIPASVASVRQGEQPEVLKPSSAPTSALALSLTDEDQVSAINLILEQVAGFKGRRMEDVLKSIQTVAEKIQRSDIVTFLHDAADWVKETEFSGTIHDFETNLAEEFGS